MTPALSRLTVGSGLRLEPPFDASLNNFAINAGEVDTFEITGTKMESSSLWAMNAQLTDAGEVRYYNEDGQQVKIQVVETPPPPSNPDTLTVTVDFTQTPTAVRAVMRLGLYSFKYHHATIYTINITK